jgi:O-antigen ligase
MALAQLRSRAPRVGTVGAGLALVGLAVVLGLASAVLPPWFIVAALLLPAVAMLVLARPELGLIALLAFVCGLVHPALQPHIPIFGGALAAADVTLAMLAVYAAWMLASQNGTSPSASAPVIGARWLATALGLFAASFVIAIPLSLWYRDLNPTTVLGEARDLAYLAVLPIALVILRQPARQRRFVVGVVVLGCLFSVGQILQGVFNIQVFGVASRLVVLETLGREEYGTTRSLTLGTGVITFALLLTLGAYMLGVIRKPLFLAVSGLLLVGIALTFGRTTYATVAVSLFLAVVWLDSKKLPQLVGLFVLFVALGSATVGLLKPQSLAAAYYRITSVGTEVASGYSAQGRIWEFEAMLPQIQQHPWTGLGLGADYIKRRGASADSGLDRYVHNAYLYMAGKLGLPALLFFLATVAAILAIGRRCAKSDAPASSRVIGAAGAAMMVCFLLASVTEPHFMSDYSLVVIAVVGALVVLSAQGATAAGATATAQSLAARSSLSRARR